MPKSSNPGSQPAGSNPAPLGLFGFGMTTVLLNLVNAGIVPLAGGVVMIISMALFYGGLIQILVGMLEFKKGNTFGTVAFSSYGAFWMSVAALFTFNKLGGVWAVDATSMGAYLAMWGFFTVFMFIGTLKMNRGLQVVFGSLTILFFLLAISDLAGIATLKTIAGIEGIFVGASAMYVAGAEVLNEVYKRTVLPL